jgi:hypothetical protein
VNQAARVVFHRAGRSRYTALGGRLVLCADGGTWRLTDVVTGRTRTGGKGRMRRLAARWSQE